MPRGIYVRKTVTVEKRFWLKVNKTKSCWVWTGYTDGRYGLLSISGHPGSKNIRVHRLSWELHYGKIPEGMWVLHHCDNPPCVNPKHLFIGDRRDNMLDAAKKGRICTIGKSRQTHCYKGHEFTVENTQVNPIGHRRCRTCTQELNIKRGHTKRSTATRTQERIRRPLPNRGYFGNGRTSQGGSR